MIWRRYLCGTLAFIECVNSVVHCGSVPNTGLSVESTHRLDVTSAITSLYIAVPGVNLNIAVFVIDGIFTHHRHDIDKILVSLVLIYIYLSV